MAGEETEPQDNGDDRQWQHPKWRWKIAADEMRYKQDRINIYTETEVVDTCDGRDGGRRYVE